MTIKNKINEFEKLMREHEDVGACDTEPRALFRELLERSFAGKDFDADSFDSDHWQLYYNHDDVAEELTAKYEQLHHAIQEASHREVVDAANYFGIEY
jgi:hypothetical protein